MSLTLYHSPQTRSTRVLALINAMGKLDEVSIVNVSVPRQDGSGGPDEANPHPEKKVPVLVHDGEMIRESSAIMVYLTDHFESALGRKAGETGRGTYLSWMAYYGGVVEPVMVTAFAGLQDNPIVTSTFRGLPELYNTLSKALEDAAYLMGDEISAVDFIMASPFQWAPNFMPDNQSIQDWVKRVAEHPSSVWAAEQDAKALAEH